MAENQVVMEAYAHAFEMMVMPDGTDTAFGCAGRQSGRSSRLGKPKMLKSPKFTRRSQLTIFFEDPIDR
jgi:hypothetical protein